MPTKLFVLLLLVSACGRKADAPAQHTGSGIPPELRGRLFELFATNKKGGTGLGLAIVKKIVDDHRGTITCDSGSTGTTFTIELPIRRTTDAD